VKQSNKPHPAEVILAELMSASFPLTRSYLEVRSLRESGSRHSELNMIRDLNVCESAGLIVRSSWGWETSYNMTDEGRALILQRPPYNCYRAIRDELAACGPLMASELEHACRRQASDYCADVFLRTLYDMLQSGLVVDCTEPGDAHSTYDLPEASE
jgi:hypothetical protein